MTSAVLASLSTILEKKVLEKEHSFMLSAAISVLTALLLSPALFIYRETNIPLPAMGIIFFSSILCTIAFIEVTKGVRHMDISSSAPLFLLSPLMTALMAFIFLGETLLPLQLLGMTLLATGTYVLQTKKLSEYHLFLSHLTGDKYVKILLFGLFLYSITSLFDRIIIHTYSVPPMLAVEYAQLCIVINFICINYYKKHRLRDLYRVVQRHFILLVLIAICTIGYRTAQSAAAGLAAIGLVVAVKRTSSLFTTLIGGELFHEKNLARKTVACLIMVAGVLLVAYK